MDSIQIKNLKSICDSGPLSIKPITIFVGQNSSGKSSIIRCLPLLKQSTESKTLGSVLWSGKYVDYGSFSESLNFDASAIGNNEITFSFTFRMSASRVRGSYFENGVLVKLSIKVNGDEYNKDSYTEIVFEIYGSVVRIRITSDLRILLLIINGTDFTKNSTEMFRAYKAYSIIPLIFSVSSSSVSSYDAIFAPLIKEIKQYVHHRTSENKIKLIAKNLRFLNDDHIKRMLTSKSFMGDFAAGKINAWPQNSPKFKKIRDQIIFCNLERIIDHISDNFGAHLLATRYITPLRAAADRYYRIQNTSIEELDPNGSNLAMFLHVKHESEIAKMNAWLKEEVGFTINVVGTHGHASIFIIDSNGRSSNIADNGFGFSQILPVLVQIWHLVKEKKRRAAQGDAPLTIIIEQPELHLHPKMQSRVGEMFCKAIKMAKANEISLRIIIETHSKDIIDAVGRSIENKTVDKSDAAVYIVKKDSSQNIIESGFDDGGFLTHWPYGFFDGE